MAVFEIRLLGSLEILGNGKALTEFRSQKAMTLLAFLITEGRPITRAYLAGLAWPDVSQSQALGLLRRSLHNLNRLLPECLEINQRTVVFKSSAPVTVDTRRFAQLAARAEFAAWTEAVPLYRARFLEGVYLDGCPALERWLLSEQQRWEDRSDELLERLSQAYSYQGNYNAALRYATRRVNLAPWREEAYRQTMRLYLYNGQRSAALSQYRRCAAILADELDVAPGQETEALYQQIRKAAPFPPHNLPPQTTPFLGREQELEELARLIAHPEQRLITLAGPGGMGKTRLALAAAERQLGRPVRSADTSSPTYAYFTDGVYFVPVPLAPNAADLTPAIAGALGYRLEMDRVRRSPLEQLLDYLRGKRLLLLLDSFDHLLRVTAAAESTGLLNQILCAAPEVQILVTSRQRLQIEAEHFYPIEGLDYPEPFTEAAQGVESSPAVALFTKTAQRIQPDFVCDGYTAPAVVRLCHMLEGMPLAIELAAASVNVLCPAEIVAELARGLDLLATTAHDLPGGQRSVRATFETSWQQLSPSEQTGFQNLSVFLGGFSRDAAQEVADIPLTVLASLADRSFIRYRQKADRYEVHELLRQYGCEQLERAPDRAASARQRHCAYFVSSLARWTQAAKTAQQQESYQSVAADRANIRQAWLWAIEHDQHELLAQAIDGPGLFCQWQGRFLEGLELYRAACRLWPDDRERQAHDLALLVRALTWQAAFSRMLGQPEDSRRLLERGMALLDGPLFNQVDVRAERAGVLLGLGELARDHSDHLRARDLYEQSAKLYADINDRWGEARSLIELCFVVRNFGEIRSADLRREQLEEAHQIAQRSVDICREIEDWGGLADALIQFGAALFFLGRLHDACATCEEAISLAEKLGRQGSTVLARFFLGTSYLFAGDYARARGHLQAALDRARKIGYHHQIGAILYNLGNVATAEGNYTLALSLLRESLVLHRQMDNRHEQCLSLICLGYAEHGAGHRMKVERHLVEALEMATSVSSGTTIWFTLPLAALRYADEGEPMSALELYSLFLLHSLGDWKESAFFEDLAGRRILALARALPPASVTAAQERGRQRNLRDTAEELRKRFSA